MLSIIVPTLNEAEGIGPFLAGLAPLHARGAQIVVADGGSTDGTTGLAAPHADLVLTAPRGRASQMNAGAAAACGDTLLFLHADTHLPEAADQLVTHALSDPARAWGRFDVKITGRHPALTLVAAMMNARSRLTGIATGDQAMFARKSAFERAGGFQNIPLMEDVALSRALGRASRPACLRARVLTSGRRWERHGILRTILLMWRLRLAYALGADPNELALRYGYRPRRP